MTTTGTIAGTVIDQSGKTIPDAAITLTSQATNEVRAQTTKEAGSFAFTALPPGSYERQAAG